MNAITRHAIGPAALGLAAWIAATSPVGAQLEDFRTRQLMQDVAELKRVVRTQDQRISDLEREISRSTSKTPDRDAPRAAERSSQSANAVWLNLKNWERVKAGMTEKQVLDVLGYPTSSRSSDNSGGKILFYTQPVGNTGFLSGTVELGNDHVKTVQKPILK